MPSAPSDPLAQLAALEADLWSAADNLRANSKLTAGEYCMPVLGVIFLRHASNRHAEALREIQAEQAAGKMPKRPLTAADFKKRRALLLPPEARYEQLVQLPAGSDLGSALNEAMNAVERDFPPLQGQLPKDYARFENELLHDLLRVFDSEPLRAARGDVFGRINEYFLMKFAMQGAQDNGEFFTPPSLVQTLVNILEPDHGVIFDPACGSGGMFVQSSHFIESRGDSPAHRATFYGQEYKTSNLRLAKMNLAVHALEGNVVEANTFYADEHELLGKCDFVMANPPFNVDKVDAEKVRDDPRLPFGLPGVNKDKKVSNGNYLWISYFWAYLNQTGRAGFVMSSQASSAGHGEAEVRRKLVETGDVDVMVSIRSNFFYTRTVPCELWCLDRGKPAALRDTVLMLDARHVYRKVTRKIYDFSPEQQQNLTAIVWLHRGQHDRFEALLENYRDTLRAQRRALVAALPAAARAGWDLGSALKACNHPLSADYQQAILDIDAERAALEKLAQSRDYTKDAASLPDFAAACRAFLVKLRDIRRAADAQLPAALDAAPGKDVKKQLKAARDEAETAWSEASAAAEAVVYQTRHYEWLRHRFPDGRYVDVPGLCRRVTRADIAAADWSLTPGRYVGVAPAEEDEDFDFEQTMRDIHVELADLDTEAAALAKKIRKNFEGLGV
jgi:type I restriction enzyme M protein